MGGLARICKLHGAMVINGRRMVWDYAADKAVPETEMLEGSDRWKASELAKWLNTHVPVSENQNPFKNK